MEFSKFSIGVDIEDVNRFLKYEKNKNSKFVNRIYTKNEIEYCFKQKKPSQHLAARYCAKEATIKALNSLNYNNIYLKDIEICKKGNLPCIKILLSKSINVEFKVSLSHSETCAVASVIVYINK